ncbi:MAG: AAA family ATPase [Chloroflexi bacterium]|nr:AAA family ATPase [Chloroflexota bacterium]
MDTQRPLVCPILVGRDELLGLAMHWLSDAARGRGGLRFLAGEAGIGKTRLVGSIERQAIASGFAAVRGGTYPGDLEVSGAVLLDLARNLRRQERFAATGRAITDRLLEAPGAGTVAVSDESGDAHRRRRILALDLAELLGSLSARGPILVTLEDLHQADDLTLAVISTLAQSAMSAPMVVLGTYRSDELYPRVPMRDWRSLLLTKRLAEEVRLDRLTPEGTATMTSVLLGRPGVVPSTLAATIHQRTDGIPLHVEELLGMLTAGGSAALESAAGADVPDTLDDAGCRPRSCSPGTSTSRSRSASAPRRRRRPRAISPRRATHP